MSSDHSFTAYELYPDQQYDLEPAPIQRDWMEKAHVRFPYRCLPLAIANQCGWILRRPRRSASTGMAGSQDDVEVRFDGPPDNRITSATSASAPSPSRSRISSARRPASTSG